MSASSEAIEFDPDEGQEEPEVWQGYVSAITCLLLALLLLLCILAGAILTVKSAEHATGNDQNGQDAQSAAQISTASATSPVPPSSAASSDDGADQVMQQWILRFPRDVIAIGETQRKAIANEVLSKVERSSRLSVQWAIKATVPPSSPEDERAAYLRVMSVRQTLLDSGIDPAEIEVRIVVDERQDRRVRPDGPEVVLYRKKNEAPHGNQ